ncbi:hypothetical protein JXO59_04405 [candidate division KSB1 bacterium]|nr:hypothetical protein [candidate division KSB1 bacterium]
MTGILILFAMLLTAWTAHSQPVPAATVPPGCTVFTISKGEQVFFGGNDDYIHPDSYHWIDPGDDEHYGAIWIGRPDNVQQGVNEHGLAYDANGLPRVDVNPHHERLPVEGDYTSYPIHILHQCATVEEVIAWVNAHQWHSYMHDQMQFADATGDAVIISAGKDGEVVFTRKPRGDGFLVSSNFNVANPGNGFSYPCWRYDLAQALLNQLLEQESRLTHLDAAGVLKAVHTSGGSSWTIESLVADLPNGLVYLYYFHQFDRPVLLNVKEELTGQRAPGPLSRLFPDDVQQEAARRYQVIQDKARRCRWFGILWLSAVIVSLLLLIILAAARQRPLRFYLPAVIILGPVALLLCLVLGWKRQPGAGRVSLIEALGDVMPTVIAFVALMVIIILIPPVQSNPLVQLGVVLFLPLLVAWLLFHGPLLAPVKEKSYGHLLIHRLPQVLVTANLGMAGINAVAMPLVMLTIRICTVLPITAHTLIIWWGIAVLGALAGVLLILPYERWAIKRGFRAWSLLIWKEGEIRTPSWRKLGWWIALSYAVLLLGLAAGAMLSQLVK